MTLFIHTQKQKQLSIKVTSIMYLKQSILKLYWMFDSVIDDNSDISKYSSLARSSFIKLPKELDHSGKELINIQNIDNKE